MQKTNKNFKISNSLVLLLIVLFYFNVNAQTVIATRTDGNSVTYNCDGVDDHIQINKALEYVQTAGGVVELSANTFFIDSTIWFAGNNTTLQGAGMEQTTIKLIDEAGWCHYYYDENSVLKLKQGEALIANKSTAMQHLSIQKLKIDGNKYNQHTYNPETKERRLVPDGNGHYDDVDFLQLRKGATQKLSDIHFSYIFIYEGNSDALIVHNGENITVDHCKTVRIGHSAIYFLDPINFVAEYNDFLVTANSGIRWYDGNHIVIRNNLIEGESAKTGNSNFCIEVTSGQASTITEDVIIEKNTMQFTAGAAIALDAKEAKAAKNVVIRNNTILQCGNTGTLENRRETGGINIKNFTNTLIENNTIVNCLGGGIRLGGYVGFNDEWEYETGLTAIIKNNIITNTVNGGNNNAPSYGIDIAKNNSAECTYNNVWDNYSGNYNGCEPGRGSISIDPKIKSIKLGTKFHDTKDVTADLHLQSETGRWNDLTQTWETDTATSVCVNGGEPNADYSNELTPNGNRVNLGAYGNTIFASKGAKAPPVADAGVDQYVRDDDGDGIVYVTLDGSKSSDNDTIVSYSWVRNNVQIASEVNPAPVPFVWGTYEVILTVTDNDGTSSTDKVMITVNPKGDNIIPISNAGDDITVTDSDNSGSNSLTLDGTKSFDEDGTIVNYVWVENDTEIATKATPTVDFKVGIHHVILKVTDNEGAFDLDTVQVNVKSKQNYALYFNNDSDDEAVLINGLPIFASFTIEMWIKQTGSDSDTDGLLWFGGDGKRLTLKGKNHQPTWGESWQNSSTIGIKLNEWHHLAFAVDNSSLAIYIDGVSVSIDNKTTIQLPEGNFSISTYYYSIAYPRNFIGCIDELRYWDVVRTETQINNNRDVELSGTEAGLVGYWDFNDGSGKQLTDKVGKHHGTLSNMDAKDWISETPFNITSVKDSKTGISTPNNYFLSQNYPNPFNPSTVINFTLPKLEFVNLSVYNMLGEKVKELVNNTMKAGFHTVTFNASNSSSGIYFYKVSAGNFVSVKKMILLK